MKLKELKNFIDEAVKHYGGDASVTLFDEHGDKLSWPLELSRWSPSDDKEPLTFSQQT